MQFFLCCTSIFGALMVASLYPFTTAGSCPGKDITPSCLIKSKDSDELCARSPSYECNNNKEAYREDKSTAVDNRPCVKWSTVEVDTYGEHNDFKDEHNYCRSHGKGTPYCYVRHKDEYERQDCFRPCVAEDEKECGNGIIVTSTQIHDRDPFQCTHMLGVAWNMSDIQHWSIWTNTTKRNPEDCCQQCKAFTKFPCVAYTWRNEQCIFLKKTKEVYIDEGAISGEVCGDHKINYLDRIRESKIKMSGQCTYLPGVLIEPTPKDHQPVKANFGECCGICMRTSGCLGYTWTDGHCQTKFSLKRQVVKPFPQPVLSGELCKPNKVSGRKAKSKLSQVWMVGLIVLCTLCFIVALIAGIVVGVKLLNRRKARLEAPCEMHYQSPAEVVSPLPTYQPQPQVPLPAYLPQTHVQ